MDMHKRVSERGQSLVEFALTVPLLVLILMGALDLGRTFNAYIIVTNAARNGAYYGTLHPADASGITACVVTEAQSSGITLTSSNVTIVSSGVTGTPMRVTVSYDFSPLSLYILHGQVLHLVSSTEMVII